METFWTRYRRDLAAIAFLFILGTLTFADVLFGFRSLYIRDLTRYYYPTKRIIREVILGGEMPYWNRYYSAGQPMAANPEYEAFYPPQWLILLPDYDLGYRLHIFVHVYIALLAMYLLLRSMGLRIRSSCFGAIMFGLGGLSLSLINLLPIYFCFVWMPLIFLFGRRYLLRPNISDFALTAIFLGIQMLPGEPTTLLQTWTLLGLYGLYRAWYSDHRWRDLFRNQFAILGMGISGALVGGVQLIAAIDHAKDSIRARGFEYSLVSTWSLHPTRPLELIFPGLFGYVDRQGSLYWASGFYKNTGSPFYFNIYLGLLAVILAVAAIRVRPRGGRIVAAICAASYLVALGGHTPLLRFLYDQGIAGSLRYFEKFSLTGLFVLMVFSAKMFDRCLRGDVRLIRAVRWLLIFTTVVAAGFAIFSFFPPYADLFKKVWGHTNPAAIKKFVGVMQVDWIIAVARGVLALGVIALVRRQRFTAVPAVIAGTLLAADLYYVTLSTLPRMPRRFFTPPDVVKSLDPARRTYRIFHEGDWYGQSQIARAYFSTGDAIYWIVRNGLFPMTPATWGFETVLERDYDKTALLPTVDVVDAMWKVRDKGQKRWHEMLMSMSNGRYRGNYITVEQARKETNGNFKIAQPIKFADVGSYPRYYFATRLVHVKDDKAFIDRLVKNDWSPATAYVSFAPFTPASGKVLRWSETANTARIEVETSGRSYLVMSVTPHKYWSAAIDGKRAELMTTNIGYQGLVVPAGRHVVTMRYRNPIVAVLAPTCVVSGLFFLIVGLRTRRRGESWVIAGHQELFATEADLQQVVAPVADDLDLTSETAGTPSSESIVSDRQNDE